MPNARARVAMASPMLPKPTMPSVRSSRTPSGATSTARRPGAHTSGRPRSKASIVASTCSAIGTLIKPRAHVTTRPCSSAGGYGSAPADGRCTHSIPVAHSTADARCDGVSSCCGMARSTVARAPLTSASDGDVPISTTRTSDVCARMSELAPAPSWLRMTGAGTAQTAASVRAAAFARTSGSNRLP